MKLDKETWKTLRFGDFAYNVSERVEPKETKLNVYIGLEHIDSGQFRIERFGSPDEVIGVKLKFYKGDVIFGKRRAYQRKAGIAEIDGICSAHSMVLRAKEETVIKQFFPYFLHSDVFMNKAVEISEGSLSPTIKWKTLEKQEFVLPPIDEQKNILAFFQTLETIIEQAEKQEKNLRGLAKRLIDDLMSDEPTFGNLLEGKEPAKVKFAEITDCIEQHQKETLPLGLTRFVGLENIEPETFRISTSGNIADGTTFTKTFAGGDVLFGKRRAYLKKVAVAEFDGICSSDILVFRAKEDKMLAELLPFYAASESFIQYAVNTSAGSLSPRTKWRDLAKFEIHIPDLETQAKILEVLQQIQKTIEQMIGQKQTLKNLKFKLLNEILG